MLGICYTFRHAFYAGCNVIFSIFDVYLLPLYIFKQLNFNVIKYTNNSVSFTMMCKLCACVHLYKTSTTITLSPLPQSSVCTK